MAKVTQEEFLKDVKDHQMTVLRDDGVYRHITFNIPGSSDQSFSLITWPGSLCYTGDMGTYVFQRLNDMFEFFAPSKKEPTPGDIFINEGYWAEKCEAQCRDGVYEYDPDVFIEKINMGAKECLESHPEIDKDDFLIELDCEVISSAEEGEDRAMRAALDFKHDDKQVFVDFWEIDLNSYTTRYLWCCYAIAWGIEKYNQSKAVAACDVADPLGR